LLTDAWLDLDELLSGDWRIAKRASLKPNCGHRRNGSGRCVGEVMISAHKVLFRPFDSLCQGFLFHGSHRKLRGSIRARSISAAPAVLDRYPHGVTGHVVHGVRSIQARCKLKTNAVTRSPGRIPTTAVRIGWTCLNPKTWSRDQVSLFKHDEPSTQPTTRSRSP